jgi:hypothetical protein
VIRRPFNRGEQHAPQRVANRGAEAALERLRVEATEAVGQGFALELEPLGTLKAFPEHSFSSFRKRAGSSGLQACVSCPPASRCRPEKLRADGCD